MSLQLHEYYTTAKYLEKSVIHEAELFFHEAKPVFREVNATARTEKRPVAPEQTGIANCQYSVGTTLATFCQREHALNVPRNSSASFMPSGTSARAKVSTDGRVTFHKMEICNTKKNALGNFLKNGS